MKDFIGYYKKSVYIAALVIITIFFFDVNHEHLLGLHKMGIVFKCITIILTFFNIIALAALLFPHGIVKYFTGRLIFLLLIFAILLNVVLFNRLEFQKLPPIKWTNDNSLLKYNITMGTTNPDYPIYFYCNEKFRNAILYTNFKTLDEYGISKDLLKSWGSIKKIISTEEIPNIIKDIKTFPRDTLSVKGDTVYLANINSQGCLNDTLYFIGTGNHFYLVKK